MGSLSKTSEEWRRENNRRLVAVIPDEDFWLLIANISKECNEAHVQTMVKDTIDKESARLLDEFEAAAYTVMVPGFKLFPTDAQRVTFGSSLKTPITVNAVLRFMVECLPTLVELGAKTNKMTEKPKAQRALDREQSRNETTKVLSIGSLHPKKLQNILAQTQSRRA